MNMNSVVSWLRYTTQSGEFQQCLRTSNSLKQSPVKLKRWTFSVPLLIQLLDPDSSLYLKKEQRRMAFCFWCVPCLTSTILGTFGFQPKSSIVAVWHKSASLAGATRTPPLIWQEVLWSTRQQGQSIICFQQRETVINGSQTSLLCYQQGRFGSKNKGQNICERWIFSNDSFFSVNKINWFFHGMGHGMDTSNERTESGQKQQENSLFSQPILLVLEISILTDSSIFGNTWQKTISERALRTSAAGRRIACSHYD